MRWLNAGRGDAKHRYFRRRHDALEFEARLRGYGKQTRVFVTDASWSVVAR